MFKSRSWPQRLKVRNSAFLELAANWRSCGPWLWELYCRTPWDQSALKAGLQRAQQLGIWEQLSDWITFSGGKKKKRIFSFIFSKWAQNEISNAKSLLLKALMISVHYLLQKLSFSSFYWGFRMITVLPF